MLIGGGILATGIAAVLAPPLAPLIGMLGMTATGAGATWLGTDYFSGKSDMSEKERGMQANTSSMAKSASFYDRKIVGFNNEISELEFNNSIGGLSNEETSKLITTRKLRDDAVKNKGVQIKSLSTMADIYAVKDTGDKPYNAEDYIEYGDDQTIENDFGITETVSRKNHLQGTTGAALYSYLKANKSVDDKDKVSNYLGAATIDVQNKSELSTRIEKNIKDEDNQALRETLKMDAGINTLMYEKFKGAAAQVDYNDSNQVETVKQAEVARLNSMVIPQNSEEGMKKFKEFNQATLVKQAVSSNILSSMSSNKNERDLYASIDMASSDKLAMIGINDPLNIIKKSKESYLEDRGVNTESSGWAGLSSDVKSKLGGAGINNIDDLTNDNLKTSI